MTNITENFTVGDSLKVDFDGWTKIENHYGKPVSGLPPCDISVEAEQCCSCGCVHSHTHRVSEWVLICVSQFGGNPGYEMLTARWNSTEGIWETTDDVLVTTVYAWKKMVLPEFLLEPTT